MWYVHMSSNEKGPISTTLTSHVSQSIVKKGHTLAQSTEYEDGRPLPQDGVTSNLPVDISSFREICHCDFVKPLRQYWVPPSWSITPTLKSALSPQQLQFLWSPLIFQVWTPDSRIQSPLLVPQSHFTRVHFTPLLNVHWGTGRPLINTSNFNTPTSRATKLTLCEPSSFSKTETFFTATPVNTGFMLSFRRSDPDRP